VDAVHQIVTPDDLAVLAADLPPCIVTQCCGESIDDLAEFFWYKTNIVDFGQRLVSIAGLAISALYLDARKSAPDFSPDPHFEDFLRSVLFARGYDRGFACAIVQRAGMTAIGPFEGIVSDKRLVTRFVEGAPDRPSNFLRAELRQPAEQGLAALIRGLHFLTDLTIGRDDRDTHFRGRPLDLTPFLLWDGRDLLQFRQLITKGRTDFELGLTDQSRPDESIRQHASGLLMSRLTDIAVTLGVPQQLFDGASSPEDEDKPISIIPGLAARQPQLSQLAHMLLTNCMLSTKIHLLQGAYSSEYVKKMLESPDGDIFFANEIIRKCLAEDPVSVIEDYFNREPEDPKTYIDELSDSPQSAQATERRIREACDRHAEMVRPFFCLRQHETKLQEHLREYEARLAAQRVVKLMGFDIVEVTHEEDVMSYVKRAQAFREYLEHGREQVRSSMTNEGLLACAKAAEGILGFLYRFYRILPYFDPCEQTGVSPKALSVLEKASAKTQRQGFGTLIGMFRGLERVQEITEATERLLGRSGVWPSGSEDKPFAALNELNKQRNHMAHRGNPENPPSEWSDLELVQGYQSFLDWLLEPMGVGGVVRPADSGAYAHRIYPAIVALNLQTETRSGITSLRYILRDAHDGRREVMLYTMQRVSVKSCYYGLPHAKTDSRSLWNNPVLIQTDVLSAGGEDLHGET
jgi:hypothetical protein